LPRTSSVYIFKGEGTLPLYIGKSLDIRSRLLAHLRAEDEADMIALTKLVEFIETAGEIGVLLLEARLIKQQSPLFNIRLRRLRNLCSIRLADEDGVVRPEIFSG
jgi:excinuclease Cho